MRIEINSGGLGAFAISEYQSNLSSFLSDAERVISSFKTVESATYDLNGGVGTLQDTVGELSARIRREEDKLEAAVEVRKKSNDFVDLAVRVDSQVAVLVNKNKDEFYRVHPWLRPATDVSAEAPFYERAWNWLCGGSGVIAADLNTAWDWARDTAKKAWNGLVQFYHENKKIIDTVLIVVGAVAAIAAVIASGGLALVPLLGALGVSTAAAIAISSTIAVVAVVSTLGAGVLNIVDIWAEVDDPTFNFFQKAFTIVSVVSNLTYSIGNIYNSIRKITPQEYIANHPAAAAQPQPQPQTLMFDETTPISRDSFVDGKYYADGNHSAEFKEFWETGGEGRYHYTRVDNPQVEYIKAKDVEGVYLFQSEVDNPAQFWNKTYSKAQYVDYIKSGNMANNPLEVTKVNDSFYYFVRDGRHRVLTAMELDADIPVQVVGYYTPK